MAISSATISRSSVISGLNNSNYCSVCGRATSVTSNVYASYGGRVGSDSYVCETCGKTLTSQKNSSGQSQNSFYTASGVTKSGYCPQCNTSSNKTSWAGTVASTSSSASTSQSSGTVYGGPSWTR
jgi:RNA polymerase subunit RPABC4/transcription elongation factor Spt4